MVRGSLGNLVSRALSVGGRWQHQQLRRLNIHEYQGADLMGKFAFPAPKSTHAAIVPCTAAHPRVAAVPRTAAHPRAAAVPSEVEQVPASGEPVRWAHTLQLRRHSAGTSRPGQTSSI